MRTSFFFRLGLMGSGLLWALTACTPMTTLTPSASILPAPSPTPLVESLQWLQGIPCRPPCWEGITPGLSTYTETVALLQQHPSVSQLNAGSEVFFGDFWGHIEWDWRSSPIYHGSVIYDSTDTTTPPPAIEGVMLSYDGSPLAFSAILATYGEPSHIAVIGGRGWEGDGPLAYGVDVVYLDQGFTVSHLSYDTLPVLSATGTTFEKVMFFVPDLEGLRATHTAVAANMVPWEGFKDLTYYCRGQYTKICQTNK